MESEKLHFVQNCHKHPKCVNKVGLCLFGLISKQHEGVRERKKKRNRSTLDKNKEHSESENDNWP